MLQQPKEPDLKKMRTELGDGEFVVMGDFAENHCFVVQDEAQSYHWNKKSCTLHPVIYYKNKDAGVIEGCPLVYMLDDLKHDYYTSFTRSLILLCSTSRRTSPMTSKR